MNKKIFTEFQKSNDDLQRNFIAFPPGSTYDYRVEIFNSGGKKIDKFLEIDENAKAKLIIKARSDSNFDISEKIKIYLKREDFQKIESERIEVKNISDFRNSVLRKIYKELFEKEFGLKIGREESLSLSSDCKITINKAPTSNQKERDLYVEVKNSLDPGMIKLDIRLTEIELLYFPTTEENPEEFVYEIPISKQEENKGGLKIIIIFLSIASILGILFIFRKQIFDWLRKDKTDTKIRKKMDSESIF